MITDEEITRIAQESGFVLQRDESAFHNILEDFARAIYQLGRQHQMESDSELVYNVELRDTGLGILTTKR